MKTNFPLYRQLSCCLLIAGLMAGSGCNWLNQFSRRGGSVPAPVLMEQNASRESLVGIINQNTQRVRTLQTQSASLQVPGAPRVSANFAFERPAQLRFRAGTVLGQEVDLGSNPELFWFWAKHIPQPSLMYARHAQFASSPLRSQIPIEPRWLPESLGLVEIPDLAQVEGPVALDQERLELRIKETGASGPMLRVLRVHRKYGYLLEQLIVDERGQLVVAAKASEHQYDTAQGVSLPRKLELQVPQAGMEMTLTIGGYVINQPLGDSQKLFSLPRDEFSNYPLVDLVNPTGTAANQPPTDWQQASEAAAASVTRLPGEDYQPRYRGQPTIR